MVPIIEKEYILLLGIVFYIRNMILLGSTAKKTLLSCQVSQVISHGLSENLKPTPLTSVKPITPVCARV